MMDFNKPNKLSQYNNTIIKYTSDILNINHLYLHMITIFYKFIPSPVNLSGTPANFVWGEFTCMRTLYQNCCSCQALCVPIWRICIFPLGNFRLRPDIIFTIRRDSIPMNFKFIGHCLSKWCKFSLT